jgi:uncharacterized membrane protein YdbT with pleckstrin-like domain
LKTLFLATALLLPAAWAAAAPTSAAAQCRGADRIIQKRIRFARGRTTAVVKDRVQVCTAHEYTLRARAGQTMSVNLVTGRRTTMTLHPPSGDALGDGTKSWSGELPETGVYVIHIGTDATANYTLEVTIR